MPLSLPRTAPHNPWVPPVGLSGYRSVTGVSICAVPIQQQALIATLRVFDALRSLFLAAACRFSALNGRAGLYNTIRSAMTAWTHSLAPPCKQESSTAPKTAFRANLE